jgi:hypothetical protein
MANGTTVTIEGTADEVAAVVQRISSGASSSPAGIASTGRRRRRVRSITGTPGIGPTGRTKSKGPADYIRELMKEDFFKTKRGLADVQKKLEEGAHIYPVTHLSPVLFRLVHLKELRRIKEDGTWKYVNP